MHHESSVESAAGVTLVAVRVRNDAPVARRVRVRNLLDGPVCPPRREGVPEAGWDEEGYEGVVPAEGSLGLGYACPASPSAGDGSDADDGGPAVAVEPLGRADGDCETPTDAARAVRALGRARPPADAVPDLVPGAAEAGPVVEGAAASAPDSPPPAAAPEPADVPDAVVDDDSPPVREVTESPPSDERPEPAGVPDAVASWLAAVRTRVRRAERLTDASAVDAAAALEAAGGFAGVSSLPARVEADEVALRTLAARAERLADRAAETDAEPVVESVGRLA
jgi:hypothetical protein